MITETQREPGKSRMTDVIDRQTERVPSDVFLYAAGASIATSLVLKLTKRDHEALFVGQWAPTFLLLGVITKLTKLGGRG